MTMQNTFMTIFTRTPLHVGSGSAIGAIDLPVIRERHTQFPIIPGSAIKGVLADEFLEDKEIEKDGEKKHSKGLSDVGEIIFGYSNKKVSAQPDESKQEDEAKATEDKRISAAGSISFGEAKLLAFPLRSAKGSYALATCPLALSRFKRDANIDLPKVPPMNGEGHCLAGKNVVLKTNNMNKVALEEYVFIVDKENEDFEKWANELSQLLDDEVLKEAKDRLVLLSDEDFQYFAANACMVQHHNKIKDETGVVDGTALFSVETVPSETLFYAPLTILKNEEKVSKALNEKFAKETLLQFGGKSTTGLGFCTVKVNMKEEKEDK